MYCRSFSTELTSLPSLPQAFIQLALFHPPPPPLCARPCQSCKIHTLWRPSDRARSGRLAKLIEIRPAPWFWPPKKAYRRNSSGRCAGKVSDMVFIKIMKVDGKMLEYRAPLLVKELLVDYAGHSVVNAEAVCRRLSPETELKPSELYYLLPDSHFPNDGRCVSDSQGNVDLKQIAVVDSSGGENGGVVRLKVLITKQQLAQLMCDNSPKETSLGDLLLSLRSKLQTANPSSYRDSARTAMNSSAWRPALESIPEGADVLIT